MSEEQYAVTLTHEQVKALREEVIMRDLGLACDLGPALKKTIDSILEQISGPMKEPTYPGAVVMTSRGIAVRADMFHARNNGSDYAWYTPAPGDLEGDGEWWSWDHLPGPRPLTTDERAGHGMPAPMPEITEDLVNEVWSKVEEIHDDTSRSVIKTTLEALRYLL